VISTQTKRTIHAMGRKKRALKPSMQEGFLHLLRQDRYRSERIWEGKRKEDFNVKVLRLL